MEGLVTVVSEVSCAYITWRGIRALSGERRGSVLWEAGGVAGYAVISGIVYALWNIPVLTMLVNLLLIYLLSLQYEGSMKGRILHMLLVYAFLLSAETIAMALFSQQVMRVAGVNPVETDAVAIITARLLQLFFVVVLEKLLRGREEKMVPVWQIFILAFLAAGGMYLEIALFVNLYESKPDFVLATDLVILAVCFAIVWAYDMLGAQYAEAEKNRLIRMKSLAYENELQLMKEKETEVRLLRHDMKNHCLVLLEYLDAGKIAQARDCLQEIAGQIETPDSCIQSGNKEIDSFINYKFQIAKRAGISCTVKARIPQQLPLDGFAIACILGNLLDNAVAAAKEAENPWIEVNLSYQKQNLCLVISNSYQGRLLYRAGRLVTQKEDKKLHGYGLESVRREVERCRGTIRTSHEGREYTVNVTVPIAQESRGAEEVL